MENELFRYRSYFMKTIFSILVFLFTIGVCLELESQVIVELRDQHGDPVPNAIVSIAGTSAVDTNNVAVVDQVDEQFVPRVSYVYKGQQVHFPNSDDVRHHVYSFSKAKTFELKLYSGSASKPMVFDTAGVVVLGCNIHDRMIGYIYIAENEIAAKTDAVGRASIDEGVLQQPYAGHKISVWHPRLGLTPDIKMEYALPAKNADGVFIVEITLAKQKKDTTQKTKSRFRSGFY